MVGTSPSRGPSTRRRRDEDNRRYSTSYRADNNNKDRTAERGRTRASRDSDNNDDGLVDYIHERDRLPRPTLKHRESSREGKRRHEYRYYDPPQKQRAGDRLPRARSTGAADRHRSRQGGGAGHPSREREEEVHDRRSIPRSTRRMSMSGGGGGGRGSDDRRENNNNSHNHSRRGRRASVSFDDTTTTTGKKRSVAQNLGKAAIAAGAMEAVRQRGKGVDDRGAWKRVATAALGAAAIDAAATKVRGRDPRDQGKKSTLGASLGGLVVEGLVHRIKT